MKCSWERPQKNEDVRVLNPVSAKTDKHSFTFDWIGPRLTDSEVSADSFFLVVEKQPGSMPVRRLGTAYGRIMDFLVAGADVKEVLIR
jgi:hypothetical protein